MKPLFLCGLGSEVEGDDRGMDGHDLLGNASRGSKSDKETCESNGDDGLYDEQFLKTFFHNGFLLLFDIVGILRVLFFYIWVIIDFSLQFPKIVRDILFPLCQTMGAVERLQKREGRASAMKTRSGKEMSNKHVVPAAKDAMEKFKMETANEVGVNLKQGYNGDLTSKQAGSIGGQMVKKMIENYENNLNK